MGQWLYRKRCFPDRCNIGYDTKIKDKASILEKAVIGSRSVIKDGIKIHPSVKIMSNKVIDIDTENTRKN